MTESIPWVPTDVQILEAFALKGVVDVSAAHIAAVRDLFQTQQAAPTPVGEQPYDLIRDWRRENDAQYDCQAVIGRLTNMPPDRDLYQHHQSGKLFLNAEGVLRYHQIMATGRLVVNGAEVMEAIARIAVHGDTLETWSTEGVPFYKLMRKRVVPEENPLLRALKADIAQRG